MTTTDESEDLLAHLFVGGNIQWLARHQPYHRPTSRPYSRCVADIEPNLWKKQQRTPGKHEQAETATPEASSVERAHFVEVSYWSLCIIAQASSLSRCCSSPSARLSVRARHGRALRLRAERKELMLPEAG